MSVIKVTATAVNNFSALAGTPTGGFMRYKLISSTNVVLGIQDIPVTVEPFVPVEVDWPDFPVGHYTMSAQRYDGHTPIAQAVGPEFTEAVSIDPPPPVIMSVPVGMTITVV
jgi:hypothetical protein